MMRERVPQVKSLIVNLVKRLTKFCESNCACTLSEEQV